MNDNENRTRNCYWDAYRTLNNLADMLFDLHMRMNIEGCTSLGVMQAQELLRQSANQIREEQLKPLPVEVS